MESSKGREAQPKVATDAKASTTLTPLPNALPGAEHEAAIISRAAEALRSIRRSFELWLQVGEALAIGRRVVMTQLQINNTGDKRYEKAMSVWLEKQPEPLNNEKLLPKATRHWTLKCWDHREAMLAWRATRPDEGMKFNFPEGAFRRWAVAEAPDLLTRKQRAAAVISRQRKSDAETLHAVVKDSAETLQEARPTLKQMQDITRPAAAAINAKAVYADQLPQLREFAQAILDDEMVQSAPPPVVGDNIDWSADITIIATQLVQQARWAGHPDDYIWELAGMMQDIIVRNGLQHSTQPVVIDAEVIADAAEPDAPAEPPIEDMIGEPVADETPAEHPTGYLAQPSAAADAFADQFEAIKRAAQQTAPVDPEPMAEPAAKPARKRSGTGRGKRKLGPADFPRDAEEEQPATQNTLMGWADMITGKTPKDPA
jgi:hypothetical protein